MFLFRWGGVFKSCLVPAAVSLGFILLRCHFYEVIGV